MRPESVITRAEKQYKNDHIDKFMRSTSGRILNVLSHGTLNVGLKIQKGDYTGAAIQAAVGMVSSLVGVDIPTSCGDLTEYAIDRAIEAVTDDATEAAVAESAVSVVREVTDGMTTEALIAKIDSACSESQDTTTVAPASQPAQLVGCPKTLAQFLASIKLDRYAEAIVAEGFDELEFLLQANEADLEELIAAVKMKKPHIRPFKNGWVQLVAAASQKS